jgi:hypothetical protein
LRFLGLSYGRPRLCVVAMLAAALICAASPARAEDLAERAAQLADAAFVMLNSLNSASADSSTGGPLLAPTAELASNAQSLANALKKSDRSAAGNAMAAIVRDQATIDAAAKGSSAVITAEWGSVKTQIAMLKKDVPPVEGPATTPSSPSAPSEPRVAASRDTPASPKVVIESSRPDGDFVLVKGYLEGTDLKDAGVYEGASKRKDINVAGVPGQQRVNFQFKIESPAPDETIRVTDIDGREASALVAPGGSGAAAAEPPPSVAPEVAPGSSADASSAAPSDEDNSSANTAEIPPAGYSATGPSEPTRRLTSLGNTQITIVSLSPVPGHPGSYEVLGDISGRVRMAGVYIDGRMMTPIRLTPGPNSSFDVIFTRLGTQNASIRAYGLGNQFVETPLAPGGSGVTTFNNYRSAYPYGPAPSVPPPGGYP